MKNTVRTISALALSLAALTSIDAQAATSSGTFPVSLNLNAFCTLAASPLNFFAPNGLGAAITTNSSISIACSNLTPYNIGINNGTVAGSTTETRLLAGSATGNTANVQFRVTQDASNLVNWGNTAGVDTYAGIGNGTVQLVPMYGVIPGQATPLPDTYTTVLTATATF